MPVQSPQVQIASRHVRSVCVGISHVAFLPAKSVQPRARTQADIGASTSLARNRRRASRRPRLMRGASWLTGVILMLAAAACGSVSEPAVTPGHQPKAAEPGQPVPSSAVHRLTVMADQVVAMDGGHSVAWATAVVTTRAKALTSATPGDFIPNDAKTVVYLVTIKGQFVDYGYSGPPGSHAPTGTYLSLVVNAKTFEGTDGGLGSKPPPVAPASLGPVTYLTVHPLARK
jgi:hypothetical protein